MREINYEFENDPLFYIVCANIRNGFNGEKDLYMNIMFRLKEIHKLTVFNGECIISAIGLFLQDFKNLTLKLYVHYFDSSHKGHGSEWVPLPVPMDYMNHIKQLIEEQEALPNKGWLINKTVIDELYKYMEFNKGRFF